VGQCGGELGADFTSFFAGKILCVNDIGAHPEPLSEKNTTQILKHRNGASDMAGLSKIYMIS
jgi:hypothetical protein